MNDVVYTTWGGIYNLKKFCQENSADYEHLAKEMEIKISNSKIAECV